MRIFKRGYEKAVEMLGWRTRLLIWANSATLSVGTDRDG